MPFFNRSDRRSARIVPEMVEYEKRRLTMNPAQQIGHEDGDDDELESPMTPMAHVVIDIPK